MHRGKLGNVYRLDGFDRWVQISDKVRHDPRYSLVDVSSDNEELSKSLIGLVHTPDILEAYKTGKPPELANSSGVLWQPKLYDFVIELALTTKLAVDQAMKMGVAIVLSGGGHHVERNRPLGFCTINSMALGALYASQKYHKKTAIVDLDVHYSNGCIDVLRGNKDVFVGSVWNKKLDKWKNYSTGGNIWHRKVETASGYFKALKVLLDKVLDWGPDIVFYHLGLDVLETDRMGGISGMGKQELYQRDKLVLDFLRKFGKPYVIFIGGGYVNYSKGERHARQQKRNMNKILKNILDFHLN